METASGNETESSTLQISIFFFGWKSSSRLWWIKSPTQSQYTLDNSSASTFTCVIGYKREGKVTIFLCTPVFVQHRWKAKGSNK